MRYRAGDEIFQRSKSDLSSRAPVKILRLKWNVLITVLWTIISKLYKLSALLLNFFLIRQRFAAAKRFSLMISLQTTLGLWGRQPSESDILRHFASVQLFSCALKWRRKLQLTRVCSFPKFGSWCTTTLVERVHSLILYSRADAKPKQIQSVANVVDFDEALSRLGN